MQLRVFVLPGGKLQIFGDEGSFEEVKAATERLVHLLQAQGLPVVLEGEIEQHRDSAAHVHVQQEVNYDI